MELRLKRLNQFSRLSVKRELSCQCACAFQAVYVNRQIYFTLLYKFVFVLMMSDA